MNTKKIGLFGFGCVGEGFYKLLQDNPQIGAEVSKICVKNKKKERPYDENWVFDPLEIINDDSIDLVVEVIDDADVAYDIVTKSLKNGKSVVSANKKMIAENLPKLKEIESNSLGKLYYEGAVCGSIPILSTIRNYLAHGKVTSFSGIFNGSTNYILTKVNEEGLSYEAALKLATENGFAESDPTLDIEGYDAAFKLSILIYNVYGTIVKPTDITRLGITNISSEDIKFARRNNLKIKLIANSELNKSGISACVIPKFISNDDTLSEVNDEYNSVTLCSDVFGKQTLTGKGAGMLPTGLAVLSDVSTALKNTENHHLTATNEIVFDNQKIKEVYIGHNSSSTIDWSLFSTISEKCLGRSQSHTIGKISLRNLKKIIENHPDISVIETSGTGREFQTNNLSYFNRKKEVTPVDII